MSILFRHLMIVSIFTVIFAFSIHAEIETPKEVEPRTLTQCPKESLYLQEKIEVSLSEIREFQTLYEVPLPCKIMNAESCSQEETLRIPKFATAIEKALSLFVPKTIPMNCIAASMSLSGDFIKLVNCSSETETLGPSKSSVSAPPICITHEYLEFLKRWMDQAISCVDTFEYPLNAAEIFAIINHESRFQVNARNGIGTGLMALTSIGVKSAAKETLLASNPSQKITTPNPKILNRWKDLETRSQCQAFRKIMDAPVQMGSDGTLTSCQLTHVPSNPARSLILGLVLYQQAQETTKRLLRNFPIKVGKSLQPFHLQFNSPGLPKSLQAYLTRVIYNRGQGTVETALKNLVQYEGIKTFGSLPEATAAIDVEIAKVINESSYSYSQKIDQDISVLKNKFKCDLRF